MSIEIKKFVIMYYQVATESIVGRRLIDDSDMGIIRKGLGWELIETGRFYSDLNENERLFLQNGAFGWSDLADEFSIRPAIWIDYLSYEVHTGKELLMMLHDQKPLSVFVDTYPEPTGAIPEHVFEPYVRSGRFIVEEYISDEIINHTRFIHRYVFYAQPSEKWRIASYIENLKYAQVHGHSPITERREGELLGYTDEQNDEFLQALKQRQSLR